jgi:uncharacterized protein VirK/YbjX
MNTLLTLLRYLLTTYREETSKSSLLTGVVRILAAMRILLFPIEMQKYLKFRIDLNSKTTKKAVDPLYFISHKSYILPKFSIWQRIYTASHHLKYETENFNCDYQEQIHYAGGIILWKRTIGDHCFVIRLIAEEDEFLEGEINIIMDVDEVRICRTSFCYINSSVFYKQNYNSLIISRNQSDNQSRRALFDENFKNNSPQLFCLAALWGLATANGFDKLFAVKHDAQYSYNKKFDSNFQNSYTTLWKSFGAVAINSYVYELAVPMKLRPLEDLNRAHRKRARSRRIYWDEIIKSTCSTMISFKNESFPGSSAASDSVAAANPAIFSK